MEPSAALYQAFREVGEDLFAQGLISATAGNFSARDGEGLWITRSGVRKNRLGPGDLLYVGLDPDPERDRGASVELVIHREVYRAMTSPWGREDGLGMYGHESGLGMYGHENGLGMLGDPDEFRFSPGFIFLLTDMDL